jgi:hypothetical protein
LLLSSADSSVNGGLHPPACRAPLCRSGARRVEWFITVPDRRADHSMAASAVPRIRDPLRRAGRLLLQRA